MNGSFVHKICSAECNVLELEAQTMAMQFLRAKPNFPRVPNIIPDIHSEDILLLVIRDKKYRFRLLEYLEGEPLIEHEHLSELSVAAIGAFCARLTLGLADFKHSGLDRSLQWDLRRAEPVIKHLMSATVEVENRDQIAAVITDTLERIRPFEKRLRVQAVHHDLTGDNILSRSLESEHLIPDAVIDFGDVMLGWLVGDLAVTCS
ncbi:hypothetical protein N0V90_010895 [Kalmusia sp. IMI 367209]|nr:hypothetical protein N0V90_010895 [Kalmusia sp. IMI 367209]